MKKLDGKIAVVTGASKGIGASIAKHLAAEGAAVVVNYASSKEGADRVVDEIASVGGKAIAVQADVTKRAEVEQLFAKTQQVFGRLDILVNNAGISLMSKQFDVNNFSLISFTTLLKTMKTLLKKSALFLALSISVLANFPLRASADSTAGIILSTRCRGGYNIDIWQNRTSGELLYRATSPNGNLSLGRGTSQATEGVRVYRFRNGNYEYWVWDGTLDNPQSGTLEVYKNNRILMKRACKKI